jgi:hypothetical protein
LSKTTSFTKLERVWLHIGCLWHNFTSSFGSYFARSCAKQPPETVVPANRLENPLSGAVPPRESCKNAASPEMGYTTWHMGRHWTYGHALRGNVPGHLLGSVCGHMHVCVGLGWDTQHGIWVDTGRVSWSDEDVEFFFEGVGVYVTPDPTWMAHEWSMSSSACV